MIEIMTSLNKYVPSVEKNQECLVESIGERLHLKKAQEHCLLFGGDQLTAARARSAQQNVMNSDEDHAPEIARYNTSCRRLAHKDELTFCK